jgi:hypothetical protein
MTATVDYLQDMAAINLRDLSHQLWPRTVLRKEHQKGG